MTKVSIIIPVYNAERYIEECIQSLLKQSLSECEFIFINDGSCDASRVIIEKYQKQDARIILINQSNQGVSAARNAGIRRAAGKYIGFVDADDYIEQDMYEIMYASVEKHRCDVIISNFEVELNGSKAFIIYPFPVNVALNRGFIEQKVLPYFLQSDNLNTACNKLYKRQLIYDYNINFPIDVTLGEDGMFNMEYFNVIQSALYIDYAGYHYREVVGSATRNASKIHYFERALQVYNAVYPKIYKGKLDDFLVRELQAVKLVESVISYIHLYLTSKQNMPLLKRIAYIKNMINHENVKEAIHLYQNQRNASDRYNRLLVDMIRHRSVLGVCGLVAYSTLRNQYRRRNTK